MSNVSMNPDVGSKPSSPLLAGVLILICLGVLSILFYGGFIEMEHRWANMEEYSHGYMIPLVALFLLYQKLPGLLALDKDRKY